VWPTSRHTAHSDFDICAIQILLLTYTQTMHIRGLGYRMRYINRRFTFHYITLPRDATSGICSINALHAILPTTNWGCDCRTTVLIRFVYIYLVVPAANSSTRCQEIEQIGVWAAQNNLKLNSGKIKEMVITGRGKRGKSANLPAPCPGIERVSSICILHVHSWRHGQRPVVCRRSRQQSTGVE